MRYVVFFYILVIWILVLAVLFWSLGILTSSRNQLLQLYFSTTPSTPSISRDVTKQEEPNIPLLTFCNLPQHIKANAEGSFDSSYSLVGAVVIFRHGDRGPLIEVPRMESLNCSFHMTSEYAHLEQTLHKLHRVWDSMQKGPFSKFPSIPNGDHCRLGLLTKQGSSQLIALGIILRESYGRHINDIRQLCDNIDAISTPYVRTYQSLRSLLYGFLGFDEAFVNVSIGNGWNTMFCQSHCKCPKSTYYDKKFKEELRKAVPLGDTFDNLSSVLGIPRKSTTKVQSNTIRDSLLAYLCHGSYSAVANVSGSITEFAEYLSREAEFSSSSFNLKRASLLKTFNFLELITNRIETWISKSDNSRGPNFAFYSGHDLTLLYLLHSLDCYDGYVPFYGSRLVIELLSDSSSRYHLRFIWNGENVSTRVCNAPYCPWDTVRSLAQDKLWRLFKTRSIEQACETSH